MATEDAPLFRQWGGFPTWWIRDKRLKQLGGGSMTAGKSIAALKVYLALAICADDVLADVQPTVRGLEDLTGLSRPMVGEGVRALEALGVLQVDRTGYRSKYNLLQAPDQVHFMKLPRKLLRARLQELPNGSASGLAALKIYMVLLTIRGRYSHLAPISHRRLQAYTAIRPSDISRGASLLIEHGLLRHANRAMFWNGAGYPVNSYYLVGTFGEGDQDFDLEAGNPVLAPVDPDLGPLEAEVHDEGGAVELLPMEDALQGNQSAPAYELEV